jgi:hypothetical protein
MKFNDLERPKSLNLPTICVDKYPSICIVFINSSFHFNFFHFFTLYDF